MSRPTDNGAGNQRSYRKGPEPSIHKSAAVSAEFREEAPPDPAYVKGAGKKRNKNADDQRNKMFLLIALIVFMVIFILLELKQQHDAVAEGAKPILDPTQSQQ